jgi:hypothetical protein
VSATEKKACPTCKGCGSYTVYVNEWTELFERIAAWWRRWRKP